MIEIVSRLPAEYQEVTHIQTNGKQSFDTEFIPNQDTRVIWKGEWVAASSSAWIFGVRTAAANKGFTMLTTGGKFRSDYGNVSGVTFSSSITTAYKIDKNKHVTTINDAETLSTTYETFECPKTLKLFACDTNGTIAGYSTAKTTATEVYDNGTLVRNYVPCYRKTDNVAGLYDLVNGVFGTFDGTDPVTVGEDVAPTIIIVAGGVISKKWALRRRTMLTPLKDVRLLKIEGVFTNSNGTAKSWIKLPDGTKINTEGEYEVETGSEITLGITLGNSINSDYPGRITVEGRVVASSTEARATKTYQYTVQQDCLIVGAMMGGNMPRLTLTIS